MKKLIIIAIALTASLGVSAQEETDSAAVKVPTIAERIEAEGKATVKQPATLNERLRRTASDDAEAAEQAEGRTQTGGYRIQVYSGNNGRQSKSEADRRSAMITEAFPEHSAYVTFDAPYWRLKVGDFLNYEDASAALSLMKARFPGFANEMRLVRARIKSAR